MRILLLSVAGIACAAASASAAPADDVRASVRKCGLEGQMDWTERRHRLEIRRIDPEADEVKVACVITQAEASGYRVSFVGDGEPDKPSKTLVEQIENRLSENPCVGPMNRWFRKFAYGMNRLTGGPDRRKSISTFSKRANTSIAPAAGSSARNGSPRSTSATSNLFPEPTGPQPRGWRSPSAAAIDHGRTLGALHQWLSLLLNFSLVAPEAAAPPRGSKRRDPR